MQNQVSNKVNSIPTLDRKFLVIYSVNGEVKGDYFYARDGKEARFFCRISCGPIHYNINRARVIEVIEIPM